MTVFCIVGVRARTMTTYSRLAAIMSEKAVAAVSREAMCEPRHNYKDINLVLHP